MANAIDTLFQSVLTRLLINSENDSLDWPRADDSKDEFARHSDAEPIGSEEDGIYSMDEEIDIENAIDRLASRRLLNGLLPEEDEAVEGGIRRRGFDAIAFYKSRRVRDERPYIGKWGIFYLKHGLMYVELQISSEYPGYGNPRKLAHAFLREHERFHFRADVQTLMFEATLGKHLYRPLHRALRGRGTQFVEEALANRQVWDWSKRATVGLREFAYDFMKLQPGAYARFDEPRLSLAAEWAANVVNQLPPGSPGRSDLAHWVESSPAGLLRSSLCPEYVVYPLDLKSWLSPALVLPPVSRVDEADDVVKVLGARFVHLRKPWDQTKRKLVENRLLRGLNFKPWPKDGPESYSVRVDENFRAHLKHEGNGLWTAYALGPHSKMGHG